MRSSAFVTNSHIFCATLHPRHRESLHTSPRSLTHVANRSSRNVCVCTQAAGTIAQADDNQHLSGDVVLQDGNLSHAAEVANVSKPILSGGGGGIFFFWQLGVVKYLQEHYDLSRIDMRAYDLAKERDIWNRPLGLAGIWGDLVREWLDSLLPDNAVDICQGRLKLVVTKIPSFEIAYVCDYTSKQDLMDACLASAHVPFFLDGKATCNFRGQACIDGSLSDFLTKGNSALLQCDGNAFIIDYYDDTELSFGRFDFLKLRSYDEVMGLIQAGKLYAERTDKAGGLNRFLGPPVANRS
ncbi:hypothetical protein WJX77_006696 [Trebouxia sp. C0004]